MNKLAKLLVAVMLHSMQVEAQDTAKRQLWDSFVMKNKVLEESVPLFELNKGAVVQIPYGRDGRLVLKRSNEMEKLMRALGTALIKDYQEGGNGKEDGILYIMFSLKKGEIEPLYIGKSEKLGKKNRNLSVNISDLEQGSGKFGRWGYGYSYHLGDLSAASCKGHDLTKVLTKYTDWRDKLFVIKEGVISLKKDVRFWATSWNSESKSVWQDYGATSLSFEEYLLIGVASDLFPDSLLNREGRMR